MVRWGDDRRVDAAAEPDPVRLHVGEEIAVYANDIDVWHTRHDIVLDLHVLGPFEPEEGERPSMPVARIRLPPTIVLRMTQLLGTALARRLGEERP